MTRDNDDAAESVFIGRLREGDPIEEALSFAGKLLRDPAFQKAATSWRLRINEARMKIDLALIEHDRRQRQEREAQQGST